MKGEVAAYGRLKLKPGQSFLQKMNYSAQKDDMGLVPADPGEYEGVSSINICTETSDDIIDYKKVVYKIYIIE